MVRNDPPSQPVPRVRMARAALALVATCVVLLVLARISDRDPESAATPIASREGSTTAVPEVPRAESSSSREPLTAPARRRVSIAFVVRESNSNRPLELAEVVYVADEEGVVHAWRASTDREGSALLEVGGEELDPAATSDYATWLRGEKSVLLAHIAGHVWHVERPANLESVVESSPREIALPRGVQLRGTVRRVKDAAPVAGASIAVGGDNGIGDVMAGWDERPSSTGPVGAIAMTGATGATGATDSNGSTGIARVTGPDGMFELGLVDGESAALGWSGIVVLAIGAEGAARVTLPTIESLDIELVMDPARLVLEVHDPRGQPIPAAIAHARPANEGPIFEAIPATRWPEQVERDALHATGGGAGRIVLPKLSRLTDAFRFAVDVSATGFASQTIDTRFEANVREKIVRVVLEPDFGVAVHGVVRDPELRPVAGAVVESAANPPITTDAEGRYRIDRLAFRGGRWWYPRVHKSGFAEASRNLDLTREGFDLAIDFTLFRIAPIAGVVTDETGAGVAGANVQLRPTFERPSNNGQTTDASGRFQFTPGGEGTWTITAFRKWSPGDRYWYRDFIGVVDGGTSDYSIVLERREVGATIDVSVVRVGSYGATTECAKIDAARVTDLASIAVGRGMFVADPQITGSHVRCENLVAGRYRVDVLAGADFGSVWVDVPHAAARATARLELGPSGTIHGRLVGTTADASGWRVRVQEGEEPSFPRTGAWARLDAPDGTGQRRVFGDHPVRADGTFELRGLPEGAYRLRAIAPLGPDRGKSGKIDAVVRRDTIASVEIQVARLSTVVFSTARQPTSAVRVEVVVRNASGVEESWIETCHHDSGDEFAPTFYLAAGAYSFRVEATTVSSGGNPVVWCPPRDGTFEVVDGVPMSIPIDLDSRAR